MIAMPYDWLITNIRLQAYNGLHLAYLAKMTHRPINILVYGDDPICCSRGKRRGSVRFTNPGPPS